MPAAHWPLAVIPAGETPAHRRQDVGAPKSFLSSGAFLIEAQHVARRVCESGRNLRRVSTDRLHDLTSTGDDGFNRCRNAVNHDVDKQAGFRRRLAARHPRPADPAHRVINARGELSARRAFGGDQIQRARLEAEGIAFQPDGRVDLDRYLWLPTGN